MDYVESDSGVMQVQIGSGKDALGAPLQTISKNGYLYVYVSNESPQDVYFDDRTVKHFTGPLLQEQTYYPFGVEMARISFLPSHTAAFRSADSGKYGRSFLHLSVFHRGFSRRPTPQPETLRCSEP
jgi:hypothetical protein